MASNNTQNISIEDKTKILLSFFDGYNTNDKIHSLNGCYVIDHCQLMTNINKFISVNIERINHHKPLSIEWKCAYMRLYTVKKKITLP